MLAPNKHSSDFELATIMSNNSQTCLTPVWATTNAQPLSQHDDTKESNTPTKETNTITARCVSSNSICCQSYQSRKPLTTSEMDLIVVLEMGPESGHEKGDTGCNHTVGHSFPAHFL